MSTWLELAEDNRIAAQELLGKGRFRSSISRSYYAAYCAVTYVLEGKVTYAYGRNNPTHEDVPRYIVSNLPDVEADRRRNAKKAYQMLLEARVDADYRPGMTCDRDLAMKARKASERVLLEVRVRR